MTETLVPPQPLIPFFPSIARNGPFRRFFGTLGAKRWYPTQKEQCCGLIQVHPFDPFPIWLMWFIIGGFAAVDSGFPVGGHKRTFLGKFLFLGSPLAPSEPWGQPRRTEWCEKHFHIRCLVSSGVNLCTDICKTIFVILEVRFHHEGGLSGSRYLELFSPDLIFVIFSPHRIFLDNFFSTQKCINYDQTDFTTKCIKFWQNWFFKKIA